MQFATYAILGFSITLNFVAIWLLSNAKAARGRYLADYKESQRIIVRSFVYPFGYRTVVDLTIAQLEAMNNVRLHPKGTLIID